MKPAPFRYLRPDGLDSAVAALARHGDEAKVLAGGQSLIPMMNFRLARPAVLIDLERLPGLDGVERAADELVIGAMARQARVARSEVVERDLPVLAAALRFVGHHQIRTRGTIGGSLAHADPAAELPALALLLDATLEATGPDGRRRVAAADFFLAPFTTALADDEILTAVRFPATGIDAWAFKEIARRSGDFAVAGVASALMDGRVRLVGFGLGWTPQRLGAAEAALVAGSSEAAAESATDADMAEATTDAAAANAAEAAREEVDPMSDSKADAGYRRDAIAILVRRCLAEMAA